MLEFVGTIRYVPIEVYIWKRNRVTWERTKPHIATVCRGQASRHWDEIISERFDWQRREAEADALTKLTPDDIRDLYATKIKAGARDRRPLLVEVDRRRDEPAADRANLAPIEDLAAFRDALELAP